MPILIALQLAVQLAAPTQTGPQLDVNGQVKTCYAIVSFDEFGIQDPCPGSGHPFRPMMCWDEGGEIVITHCIFRPYRATNIKTQMNAIPWHIKPSGDGVCRDGHARTLEESAAVLNFCVDIAKTQLDLIFESLSHDAVHQ